MGAVPAVLGSILWGSGDRLALQFRRVFRFLRRGRAASLSVAAAVALGTPASRQLRVLHELEPRLHCADRRFHSGGLLRRSSP